MVNKNKRNFTPAEKANYHRNRGNDPSVSNSKRRYSNAFMQGYVLVHAGVASESHILQRSQELTNSISKIAFSRGIKNAKLDLKGDK